MALTKKHHELYEELGSIVGAKYVSDDRAVLLAYTRDMSPFPPVKPQGAVVRPGSVEEVIELVRLANQTRTPLIPIGGGRSTLSGAPPGQPGRGIVLDMRRMDKVIEIDEVNMAVTVQCGIVVGELVGKVNERGFDVPTASTPLYANTIGGHMSGYSGGGFSKYGFSIGPNGNYVLGVKVVLPDGSVIDTGTGEGGVSSYRGHTWGRSVHGPDITGMFIADGGIFGIKVEATLRMFLPPKFQKTGARCWSNLDDAFAAFYELWKTDPFLYMQSYATAMILGPEFAGIVNPGSEPTWVFSWVSIGNSEEEIELKTRNIEAVCQKHGGKLPEPAVAGFIDTFLIEQADMGKMAAMGQLPFFEVLVSARDVLEAHKWSCEWMFSALAERGLDKDKLTILPLLLPFGPSCWDTCIVLFFDQRDKELHSTVHELMVEYLELSRHRGYVIEGSQGHESRLRAMSWTPEYYHYVRNMKKALDPNNIINPGVYFP